MHNAQFILRNLNSASRIYALQGQKHIAQGRSAQRDACGATWSKNALGMNVISNYAL